MTRPVMVSSGGGFFPYCIEQVRLPYWLSRRIAAWASVRAHHLTRYVRCATALRRWLAGARECMQIRTGTAAEIPAPPCRFAPGLREPQRRYMRWKHVAPWHVQGKDVGALVMWR